MVAEVWIEEYWVSELEKEELCRWEARWTHEKKKSLGLEEKFRPKSECRINKIIKIG